MMRLDRINRDHEIIAEPSIAQEGEVFWIMFPQAAEQSNDTQTQDDESDEQIDRRHRVEFDDGATRFMCRKIRPEPLQACPDETKTGLDRRPEIRLGGRQFV